MSNANEVVVGVAAVATSVELLSTENKPSTMEVVAKLNEVITKLNELTATPKRDRGPASTREMTDEDARKVMLGEHAALSHKDAAEKLGLSYGQVYSARKGFTFKAIYQEMVKSQAAVKQA